jgi:opacity protein-like surface antigen
MKKRILVMVLAAFVAGGAFADWYDSYAPGIDGSKWLINAGVGYGLLPYKLSIPPVSASVEYAGLKIPLSLGGYFGIAGYDEDLVYSKYSGTMIGVGARAAWHFNFIKNLDTYAGLNLGWMIYNQKVTTTVLNVSTDVGYDLSSFYYAFDIGARYFFTNNIGAYLELGYSPISVASVGLSLKF